MRRYAHPRPPDPGGRLACLEGRLAYPEGRLAYPEGRLAYPEGRLAYPEGRLAYPEGRLAYPDTLKGSFEGREAGSRALEGALQTPGE
jgi:hypothetical protein